MTEISPKWIPFLYLFSGIVLIIINAAIPLSINPLSHWLWIIPGALLILVGIAGLMSASQIDGGN